MEQGLISRKLGAWFGHEEMRCIVWRCDHLEHLIYLRWRWLHPPPILAYCLCFVPFAFIWFWFLKSFGWISSDMQLWAASSLRAQVAEILDGRSGFLADACLRHQWLTERSSSGDSRPRVQGFRFQSMIHRTSSVFSLFVQKWHVQ